MAQLRRGVISDIPAEAFLKTLGSVVPIGKAQISDSDPRKITIYVRTIGATKLDLTAMWNMERKRFAEQSKRHSKITELFNSVLPDMPEDVPLDEYAARIVAEYHREQIER